MRYLFIALLFFVSGTLDAQELYMLPKGAKSRVSSFENMNGEKGVGGMSNQKSKGHAFEPLKAGESKTLLDVHIPGVIQRMWFTVDKRTPEILRSVRLRMYWDNKTTPAVDVPFGDFFCAGLGKPVAFQSALFSNPEGRSFNCYIAMPFKTGAKIVISNESDSNIATLFYDIDFLELPKPQKDAMYFHSSWNRSEKGDADFEILPKVNGKGRFLGASIGVNINPAYPNTWWGEGEVKMFIDGDNTYPTINGTGAEDYIGTGWGEGLYAHNYQGCTVADYKAGQFLFYRFHIPDAIYFNTDFKVTIQKIGGGDAQVVRELLKKNMALRPVSVQSDTGLVRLLDHPMDINDPAFPPKGWVNFYREDDYCATAYYYLDRP